uniref:Immunoglobulin V-set domain-containing protein n=1 Tax=Acanthochromis polyacanthus TaxID=80966 RepID=A0A3Q1GDX7_9TELE
MTFRRFAVVACTLFLGMLIITNGKPTEVTHAFCKIAWLVGVPCDQVNMAIVTQIKAMGSYKLGPVTPTLIQANHTSAVGQTERVNFTMMSTSISLGCLIQGCSVSEFWFSLFDNGTNYCNLHNVIQGSGLTKSLGFIEFTNEWLCLGFGLSACK